MEETIETKLEEIQELDIEKELLNSDSEDEKEEEDLDEYNLLMEELGYDRSDEKYISLKYFLILNKYNNRDGDNVKKNIYL